MIGETYFSSKGAEISTRELNPGYICAVSQGMMGKLESILITPSTDFDHFFMLYEYRPEIDDWVIVESIAKGTSFGLLSWYTELFHVHIFRPRKVHSDDICLRAALHSLQYGRSRYDFIAVARVVCITLYDIFKQLRKFKRPWVDYTKFPRSDNSRVICTEFVEYSFEKAGVHVFDPNYLATPANFVEWCARGFVEEVGEIPCDKPNRVKKFLWRYFIGAYYQVSNSSRLKRTGGLNYGKGK